MRQAYDAFVCDLDGVVYRGPEAVPGAVEALNALEGPVQYATNNASRAPHEVAEHLTSLALTVSADQVATSSQAGAAAIVSRHGVGASVLAIGGDGVRLALQEAGLAVRTRPSDVPVVAVLQGYGPQVSAADLAEAAYAIQGGAEWVATNTDLTLPTNRGTAPGNGTLLAAVASAVGRQPDLVVGKPYAPLYLMCAQRLGVAPARALAIGDRLDTDIEGANAAGLDSLLVLTGVSQVSEVVEAPAPQRPTYVGADLRALAEEVVKPTQAQGFWVCGADCGRIVDGRWESVTPGSPAQRWTNRIHAVYAALDAGQMSVSTARRIVGT